jgi:UDP-N-acetylmuramate dehydrogenase
VIVQTDVPLAPWSTLGVGGPARLFCDAADEGAIRDALAWAHERDVPVHILGGGSNVVFAEEGFDGLVVHVGVRGIERRVGDGRVQFVAGAGEPWDAFVDTTVADGCAGLECLSGIPGLVGATPIQNVGAYGQDVAMTITHVGVVDRRSCRSIRLTNAECAFGYRMSRFKRQDHDRFVVSRVAFALSQGAAGTVIYPDLVAHFAERADRHPTVSAVRDAVLCIRRRKGMLVEPENPARRSVGSFFVNPVVSRSVCQRVSALCGDATMPHYPVDDGWVKIPAAWLIERAGYRRGTTRGPVGLSPFQAQAIINLGTASATDVVAFAADLKRAVWKAFRIALVPEPVFVGFRPSPELHWLLDAQPADCT